MEGNVEIYLRTFHCHSTVCITVSYPDYAAAGGFYQCSVEAALTDPEEPSVLD